MLKDTQDLNIILLSLLLSLLFLGIHILVIRKQGDSGVFIWLLRVFFLVGLVGAVILFLVFRHESMPVIFLLEGTTIMLYGLIVFSYILGIFGITITSVRIQILSKIVTSGENGMTKSELMKEYNRTTLIHQRLKRLLSSGEIIRKKGTYYLSHSSSPFMIHMKMQELFRRIYNG